MIDYTLLDIKLPEDFSGEVGWETPSNIALVKYWGKLEGQIPANPSISFTLSTSKTKTYILYKRKSQMYAKLDFNFEGIKAEEFSGKTRGFIKKMTVYFPFLLHLDLIINTENTFPHSSGIASSASGMSAISLCLMQIEKILHPNISSEYFYRKASFIARLGSGSACRSVYGGVTTWGKSSIAHSSDEIAIKLNDIHPVFIDFQDTILIIESGQKEVSSSVGHQLMQGHPFADSRFVQARENIAKLLDILARGELAEFGELIESEALTLHAMMMTSTPYFILCKPHTLTVIHKLWSFRKLTGTPVYFTLDAGANVHILYPKKYTKIVLDWVKFELVQFCEKQMYICDSVGDGPKEI